MGVERLTMGLVLAGGLSVQPLAAAISFTPVPMATQSVRFLRGTPTLVLETSTGAVEMTPLPADHGHITFGVAVYNKGTAPANFGIENVDAVIGGRMLAVLPEVELERRAKKRAVWTQVGIAMLSGAVAGVAAGVSATSHSRGVVRGPGGAYRWSASYRDPSAGAVGAGLAAGAGAAGIAGVQQRLDYTLGELAANVVQTTTVDPQASYGGRLVLEKPEGALLPYDVMLAVHWNGADYPFTFRVGEGAGMPAPALAAVPAVHPIPAVLAAAAPTPPAGPVQPAVLVAPVTALPAAPTPATLPMVTRATPMAVVPAAPVAGYRNNRDDAIIVPMR
jgi:hypothetical protein